jgi:hypothetical protein
MKIISGLTRFKKPSASRLISALAFALILTATLSFTGCGKKSSTAQTPAIATAAPDLIALNHDYMGWVIQNNRHAKTFEEYVAASGISPPPPPAGKKYVIDKNGFINYANN